MISVIVPVLNNEPYINRCIQSLLSQTYQDFELLLMVGRCKDQSLEKCIEWQKKDERIIVVSRKDTSLGDARNYALPIAKGEYIAYVDADDWVQPDYLEKLKNPLEEDPSLDLSCCGYAEYGSEVAGREVLPKYDGKLKVDFSNFLKVMPIVTVWTKMYRRGWLIEHGITMYDGISEDNALYVMLASVAKKIYLYREPLYCYNVSNPNSLMASRRFKTFVAFTHAMDFAMPFLENHGILTKYRDEVIRFCCRQLQDAIFANDYPEELTYAAKWFVRKHFPEIMEYMEFEPHHINLGSDPVVVFGSGKDALRFLQQVPNNIHILYIVDNDVKKAGRSLCGTVIRIFDDLLQERREIPIVISTRAYRFDIAKQLKSAGFTNFCYLEDILTQEQLQVPLGDLQAKAFGEETGRA